MSEWIAIKDQEPPKGQDVLISNGVNVRIGYAKTAIRHGLCKYTYPTHWMPLPKSPQKIHDCKASNGTEFGCVYNHRLDKLLLFLGNEHVEVVACPFCGFKKEEE